MSAPDGLMNNVRKVAMLARLRQGWDSADSQRMCLDAAADYLEWLCQIPLDRVADAEPMLTDVGHIRLEWETPDGMGIAEIGCTSMYLASLGQDRLADDSEDFYMFNADALTRFFNHGVLR